LIENFKTALRVLQDFSRKEENVTRNVHYSSVVYNQSGNKF
jgi:hypothetical protein